jgi:hypothetical protein
VIDNHFYSSLILMPGILARAFAVTGSKSFLPSGRSGQKLSAVQAHYIYR